MSFRHDFISTTVYVSAALSVKRQDDNGTISLRRARNRLIVIGSGSNNRIISTSSVNLPSRTRFLLWEDVIKLLRDNDSQLEAMKHNPSSSLPGSMPESALARAARENWKRAWRRARKSLGGAASHAMIGRARCHTTTKGNLAPVFARCGAYFLCPTH